MTRGRTSSGVDVDIYVDPAELRAVMTAFDRAGREASGELRDASLRIATGLASRLKRAALDPSAPPQARLLASTVAPRRDRIVKVSIGGTKRVGRPYRSRSDRLKSGRGRIKRAPAGALLWGSETGSDEGVDRAGRNYRNRFVRPGIPSTSGYWIAPTVRAYGDDARREWWDAVEALLRKLGFDVTRDRG